MPLSTSHPTRALGGGALALTLLVFAVALASGPSCFPEQEDALACSSDTDCFAGESCVEGTCSTTGGGTGDAGVEGDVDPDADPDAAGDAGEDAAEPDTGDCSGVGFISGIVRDQETGAPVGNAKVSTQPVSETVTSLSDGTYIINANYCFDVRYTITAEVAGYHSGSEQVVLNSDDPNANVNIDINVTQRAIRGRVTDGTPVPPGDDPVGDPIAGVVIFVQQNGQSVLTDDNGFFTIDETLPLVGDTFTLIFEKDLYQTATVEDIKLGEDVNNPNPNVTVALECRSVNNNGCGGCGLPDPANAPGGDCSSEGVTCGDGATPVWTCQDTTTTACECP